MGFALPLTANLFYDLIVPLGCELGWAARWSKLISR